MRGATTQRAQPGGLGVFQPTRLMRGATALIVSEEELVVMFQPTRLMRGATQIDALERAGCVSFNPRASCEARRGSGALIGTPVIVSTHAPHARRDVRPLDQSPNQGGFNPRASCEARPSRSWKASRLICFNPRASCEARLEEAHCLPLPTLFQPTRLMRGATLRWPGS